MSKNLPTTSAINAANLPPAGKRPWLVAAWPGMGSVGLIAAGTLIDALKLGPIAEISADAAFDPGGAVVDGGLIQATRGPRSIFYSTSKSVDDHPLIVFVAEAQPSTGHAAFADAVMDHAGHLGVERVFTFASMAGKMHPSQSSRVYGAATDQPSLDRLRRLEVDILEQGRIGGQAGLLLGAALKRGIPGMCLMGEIPFFAPGIANPGAAKSVLEAFSTMHGAEIDFKALTEGARVVERGLLDLLKQGHRELNDGDGHESELADGPSDDAHTPSEDDDTGRSDRPAAPDAKLAKALDGIESLFAAARKDRTRIPALKVELDRLGAFEKYEDQFLDLFRKK